MEKGKAKTCLGAGLPFFGQKIPFLKKGSFAGLWLVEKELLN